MNDFDGVQEVDDILDLYPDHAAADLADSLERQPHGYPGTPEEIAAIIAEMRRRGA